jgi:hypothetical protein
MRISWSEAHVRIVGISSIGNACYKCLRRNCIYDVRKRTVACSLTWTYTSWANLSRKGSSGTKPHQIKSCPLALSALTPCMYTGISTRQPTAEARSNICVSSPITYNSQRTRNSVTRHFPQISWIREMIRTWPPPIFRHYSWSIASGEFELICYSLRNVMQILANSHVLSMTIRSRDFASTWHFPFQ